MSKFEVPTSEREILDLIDRRAFVESHEVEIKREGREEQIAPTLASLAIDGGTFILGLSEEKGPNGTTFTCAPHQIDTWPERIDNMARSLDPPLMVRSTVVESDDDKSLGYIFVHIPPSSTAPHSYKGSFYGRMGATKTRLTSAEVLLHQMARHKREEALPLLLDEEEERDFVPKNQQKFGHFYLVAEPARETAGALHLMNLEGAKGIFSRESSHAPRMDQLAPEAIFTPENTPAGFALVSGGVLDLARYPQNQPDERHLGSLELRKSGGIRVFLGGGTDDQIFMCQDTWIMDKLMAAYTFHAIDWIKDISSKINYEGAWDIGVRATKLRGLKSQTRVQDYVNSAYQYRMRDDTFSRTALAVSGHDLLHAPQAIASLLLSDLLRTLGSSDLLGVQVT